MRKALEIGGFIAAAVLVTFGVVAIVMGVNGRNTVNNSLSHEYIVAGPDMTPTAIKAEAQKAGIASAVKQWPTMDIAGKTIDTGPEAQAMAQYGIAHLAVTEPGSRRPIGVISTLDIARAIASGLGPRETFASA